MASDDPFAFLNNPDPAPAPAPAAKKGPPPVPPAGEEVDPTQDFLARLGRGEVELPDPGKKKKGGAGGAFLNIDVTGGAGPQPLEPPRREIEDAPPAGKPAAPDFVPDAVNVELVAGPPREDVPTARRAPGRHVRQVSGDEPRKTRTGKGAEMADLAYANAKAEVSFWAGAAQKWAVEHVKGGQPLSDPERDSLKKAFVEAYIAREQEKAKGR